MRERPLVSLALVIAVLALGVLQAQTALHLLHSGARLRARSLEAARGAVDPALAGLRPILMIGVQSGWAAAAERTRARAGATELEIWDIDRTLLQAQPRRIVSSHWPGPDELRQAAEGVWSTGPLGDRLLHYALVETPGPTLVVRFATDAQDLVLDRHDRRRLLAAQAAALAVLLVASALALLPRTLALRRPPRDALSAYEEAMSQLQKSSVQRQAELRRLGEELRDKNALARIGALAGGIAHEVRNGLGTILAYARLVEGERASPEIREAAQGIREECDTLATVVRRFMEFVREEKLDRRDFELAALLSRVVARETRTRSVRDLVLDTASLDGTLNGDEDLLERAFENLVRNALEAAGQEGHLRISGSRSERSFTLLIEDDGPGMGEATSELQRPFASTKPGGLGLGLPLVAKIIRLHDGELSLTDRTPCGLTVRVRLPA